MLVILTRGKYSHIKQWLGHYDKNGQITKGKKYAPTLDNCYLASNDESCNQSFISTLWDHTFVFKNVLVYNFEMMSILVYDECTRQRSFPLRYVITGFISTK